MEAKFTPTVKDIIQYSREEALANGQDFIGIEHLLLGILHDKDNAATGTLKALGVDLIKLRSEIVKSFDPAEKVDTFQIRSIPLTKQAEKVIKVTYLEAKLFKANAINSFHLLLSILRNEDNNACQILINFNVNYEILRIFSSTSEYTEMDELELTKPIKIVYTNPLGLIFDTSEYSPEDIKNILSLLSELYNTIGGDYLKIRNINQFECLTELDLA